MAAPITPFASCPRLVALLLAALLLVVMLWQWQQLIQSLWLLSRSPEVVAATRPLSLEELEQQRLCLGLPLLLPEPLRLAGLAPQPEAVAQTEATPPDEVQTPEVTPEAEAPPVPPPTTEVPAAEPSAVEAVAVEPEQPPEEAEGSDLDQEIP